MNHDIFTSWRTSSRSSGTGNCVEVAVAALPATGPGMTIGVRDSKNRDGAVLGFTPTAWRTFLADARASSFDLR
jgi:hypothetical protein